MKKLLALVLALTMILALAACGSAAIPPHIHRNTIEGYLDFNEVAAGALEWHLDHRNRVDVPNVLALRGLLLASAALQAATDYDHYPNYDKNECNFFHS